MSWQWRLSDCEARNVTLRAMDIAFRDLLNFTDQQSHGQLRVLVERAGDQFAEWITEERGSK